MSLRRFPDVWLEFAAWHEGEGRVEDALATLDRAAEAIPACSMFAFYASDLLELRGDAAGAKARYEAVLDAHERDAEARAARAAADGTCATERDFEHAPMADATCLAYVEYLRCCRRCEGSASSRKAFMRARRAPGANARWEIFVAAALVEWRYDRAEKPARNVFELGLKTHISNPRYVEAYAEFLVGANDAANARVLFERAATDALDALRDAEAEALGETRDDSERRAKKERAAATIRDVFDQFVAFEHAHGTLETMRAVESRRAEALDRGAGPGGRGRKSKSECRSARLAEALAGRHSFLALRPATDAHAARFARVGARMPGGWGASAGGGGNKPKKPPAPPPGKPSAAKPPGPAPPPGKPPEKEKEKGGEKTAGLPPPPSPPRLAPGAKGAIPKKDAVTLKPAPKQTSGAEDLAVRSAFANLPSELAAFAAKMPDPRLVGAVPSSVADAVLDAVASRDVTPEGGAAAVDALNEARGAKKRPEDEEGAAGGGSSGVGGGGGGTGAAAAGAGEKRKAPGGGGREREGKPLTAAANKPPPRDVFRMRQAKQARTDMGEFR